MRENKLLISFSNLDPLFDLVHSTAASLAKLTSSSEVVRSVHKLAE